MVANLKRFVKIWLYILYIIIIICVVYNDRISKRAIPFDYNNDIHHENRK